MTNKLNEGLNFNKNPFSKLSAEEELDFHNEIFYKPNFYDTLIDDLKSGTSRFILGQRGHGKSSIIHKLRDDLSKDDIFTVVIDRFDDISLEKNKIELLNLILSEFTSNLAIFLTKNKHLIKRLTKNEKETLGLLLKLFFKPITHSEYLDCYNTVKKVKYKNKLIKFWNEYLRKPANSALNTGVMISSTMLIEHFGINTPKVYKPKEFVGEVKEIETRSLSNNEKEYTTNKRSLKDLLNRANNLVKKLHFKSSVVLFDKVDEFQELNQDINKIAAFTEDILTDTELLLQNDISIAFSLWSEIKPILSKTVRFDKFKEIDISWKKKDMEPLIDKRIQYFSSNLMNLQDIIKNEEERKDLIKISNNSPRDLISCLSDIYDFQANRDETTYFEGTSVSKGLVKFATRYDYFSLYPSRTGKNKDVITIINRLLINRRSFFSILDLCNTFNQKTRWCKKNCIEPMLKYKLITEDDKLGPNGEKIYSVVDPKINYLIGRNITSLEN
jgi:hypothetical protein